MCESQLLLANQACKLLTLVLVRDLTLLLVLRLITTDIKGCASAHDGIYQPCTFQVLWQRKGCLQHITPMSRRTLWLCMMFAGLQMTSLLQALELHKLTCYAKRHRHGNHPISHRDTSTAYTDSYLPLTTELVNSFIIFELVNSFAFSKLVNGCFMLKHVMNASTSTSIFHGNALVQGAVGCSTCTLWSGIIRRSGTCIGREQAPDRVLPIDFPTHLAQTIIINSN